MTFPVSGAQRSHYLHPGHLFASAEPWVVTTILNTCVSICLSDGVMKVGGLNHYLLPYPTTQDEQDSRFGVVAFARLRERVLALGAAPKRLLAKVFGGACVLPSSAKGDLGAKNVALARKLLGEAGIPVVAEDVGGVRARKLIYELDTATAWVRYI